MFIPKDIYTYACVQIDRKARTARQGEEQINLKNDKKEYEISQSPLNGFNKSGASHRHVFPLLWKGNADLKIKQI